MSTSKHTSLEKKQQHRNKNRIMARTVSLWNLTIFVYCRDILEPGVESSNVFFFSKAIITSPVYCCYYSIEVICVSVRDGQDVLKQKKKSGPLK